MLLISIKAPKSAFFKNFLQCISVFIVTFNNCMILLSKGFLIIYFHIKKFDSCAKLSNRNKEKKFYKHIFCKM